MFFSADLKEKFMAALPSAIVFAVLNLPEVYKLTDKCLGPVIGRLHSNGCPTLTGLAVHSAVFYMVTLYQMKDSAASEDVKRMRALKATAVFAALSSPQAYQLTRGVVGSVLSSSTGGATMVGAAAHALVYALVLVWMMSM